MITHTKEKQIELLAIRRANIIMVDDDGYIVFSTRASRLDISDFTFKVKKKTYTETDVKLFINDLPEAKTIIAHNMIKKFSKY